MRVWECAKEERIEHAEHRRVDADAEGERQRRDDGKPFVLEQHAKAIAQILRYTGHTRSPKFYLRLNIQNTLAGRVVTVKSAEQLCFKAFMPQRSTKSTNVFTCVSYVVL
jgi:hypothetical protein